MESSLHRQLKELYSDESGQVEVRLGRFRIDALRDGALVEIQHGSLAAIRDKIAKLLREHRVLVVKPIVARKQLVRRDGRGRVVARRLSPKRGRAFDLFDELVYFTRVFPHPNLVIEAPLVTVEETRSPGHGRRRRWRRNDHVVDDQRLVEVGETHRYATNEDLLRLLPGPQELPEPFDTGELAAALSMPRWVAQRAAYTCRKVGALEEVGKRRNSRLYRRAA